MPAASEWVKLSAQMTTPSLVIAEFASSSHDVTSMCVIKATASYQEYGSGTL
jgi:hypothetical protein